MKRVLFLVFCIVTVFSASAQILKFKTTGYTHKEKNYYGWTNWSPWESSSMLIQMNLNTDIVTIYSPKIQQYNIINYNGSYVDRDGDTVSEYRFIDQDGDVGTMKLMVRTTGRSEMYIQFANVIWCYSVIRI